MIRNLASGLVFLLAGMASAEAAPTLRSEVLVQSPVVTAGDMFEEAGIHAEQPMFRAPAPGTSGLVTVDAVRQAAARIGLTEFAVDGVLRVRVTRDSTTVGEAMLTDLMIADLAARGIIGAGVTAVASFDQQPLSFAAEAVPDPVHLATLRYLPGSGTFTARFILAGIDEPVDVSGRIELMVEAPHLVASKRAGEVIEPADIEMRPVPLRYAESGGYAAPGDLIGKALVRQTRAGVPLKPSDVTAPHVVSRNETVTILFRDGPLVLTAKGQALEAAAAGQPVQVLNLMSKKVLSAVVIGDGTVEITPARTNVAGL